MTETILKTLAKECGTSSARATINQLVRIGVLSPARARAWVIRQRVEEMYAMGERKTKAMEIVAQQMCCSYEHVRKCVYYLPKNL